MWAHIQNIFLLNPDFSDLPRFVSCNHRTLCKYLFLYLFNIFGWQNQMKSRRIIGRRFRKWRDMDKKHENNWEIKIWIHTCQDLDSSWVKDLSRKTSPSWQVRSHFGSSLLCPSLLLCCDLHPYSSQQVLRWLQRKKQRTVRTMP